MSRLIVNADDFGQTRGVNAGIVEAHRNGILTSTTLMANGEAFEDAVTLAHGIPELGVGVDGDYVDQQRLLIEPSEFVAADLAWPVDLQRRFDLVQSLEVAEHLPASAAATFVDTLIAHGDVILFSAAVPGQGGMHHVNERPYRYWRNLFADRGYIILDAVRPKIRTATTVEPWYRYNTFLFIKQSAFDQLDDTQKARRIPKDVRVPDISPAPYKLRKLLLRPLPVSAINILSRVHTRLSRLCATN